MYEDEGDILELHNGRKIFYCLSGRVVRIDTLAIRQSLELRNAEYIVPLEEGIRCDAAEGFD